MSIIAYVCLVESYGSKMLRFIFKNGNWFHILKYLKSLWTLWNLMWSHGTNKNSNVLNSFNEYSTQKEIRKSGLMLYVINFDKLEVLTTKEDKCCDKCEA